VFLFLVYIVNITPLTKEYWIVIGTVMAPIVAFFALCFFIWQTHIQTKTFNLDNRPYLHAVLSLTNPGRDETGSLHGLGLLYLKNEGKIPATILGKPDYIVRSDQLRNTDLMGYFERFGGFPHIRIVFPKQNDIAPIPLTPQIGKSPKLVHVFARIIYTGVDPDKKYWYVFNHLYSLKYTEKGEVEGIELMDPDEDWNKNLENEPPPYKAPDWDKLISAIDKRR
jgi:hypothetical protein